MEDDALTTGIQLLSLTEYHTLIRYPVQFAWPITVLIRRSMRQRTITYRHRFHSLITQGWITNIKCFRSGRICTSSTSQNHHAYRVAANRTAANENESGFYPVFTGQKGEYIDIIHGGRHSNVGNLQLSFLDLPIPGNHALHLFGQASIDDAPWTQIRCHFWVN